MAKESIKDMNLHELKDKLRDYMEELRNINIQLVTNQIGNKKRKWFVKRRIAQIKTIIHEYSLGIRKVKSTETIIAPEKPKAVEKPKTPEKPKTKEKPKAKEKTKTTEKK